MDYYVVGDIHGMADLAKQAANLVSATLDSEPESHVIFLGNYIDGGGQEYETLSILNQLKTDFPQRCHFLIGNHELLMLNSFYYASRKQPVFDQCFQSWWQNNAFTTLWSGPSGLPAPSDDPTFVDHIDEFIPFFEQLEGQINIEKTTPEGKIRFELTHMENFDHKDQVDCCPNCCESDICTRHRITNVFGHSITSENLIKARVKSKSCPVDAGSYLSRKLAFVSLFKQKVEILTTEDYSAFYNEQFRWIKESEEKYLQAKKLLEEKAIHSFDNPNNLCLKTRTLSPKGK